MPSKRKPALTPVETEAKILVPSLVGVRRRLSSAGARRLTRRTLEANTLFDWPGGVLGAEGRSFRVRSYGPNGSVTLKGAATIKGGLKSREEIETVVASPEAMARILLSLGLTPRFRYEKFREVWSLRGVTVCLDDTPLGFFVELEGSPGSIHRVADQLELAQADFLTESYPALWIASGRAGDMTFPIKAGVRRGRR